MRTLVRHQIAILLTAFAVFFIGLGAPKLWDEDEPEYARCTQEMLHRGDYIVPTFNNHLWTDKPVLLYWMMMGSFSVFGQTEFAARFPCALLAVGTALMTYHLGRRLFRPQVGLWAGLIVATTATFAVVSRAATPDAPLIFCTTLSLLIYVVGMGHEFWSGTDDAQHCLGITGQAGGDTQASDPPQGRGLLAVERFRAVLPRSRWWFVAMYAPMAVAVLAKGPVGMFLPVAALGVWVLTAREAKRLPTCVEPANETIAPVRIGVASAASPSGTFAARIARSLRAAARRLKTAIADFPAATWAMRPFTLIAVVSVIALPWYAAVGILTHGAWTESFFFHHNVHRFLHPMEQHAGSLFYYPVALLIGFFPWALTLILGLATVFGRLRRGDARSRPYVFALCWCATWFVVFTLSASKLSHYIAPTYPLLAVIAGLWVADWIASPKLVFGEKWFQWGWPALAALGIGFIVALPLVISHFLPGTPNPNWLGLILVVASGAGWFFQRRGRPTLAASTLVAMAVALFTTLFGIAAPPISREQTSVRLVDAVNRFADSSTPIATYRIRLPDFVYYLGRPGPIMGVRLANASNPGDSVELAHELATSGPIDPYQPDDTLLWLDNLDNALLITDLEGLEQLRPILPADAVVLARERRFLKKGELLLVGRRPVETAERSAGDLK